MVGFFFWQRKMEGGNEVVVRFMSHTPYAGLEQEMQHIPGFRPRRSGMVIENGFIWQGICIGEVSISVCLS